MSTAHDVRRHLLRARIEIEAAQAIIEETPAPENVQAATDDAFRKVAFAESQAVQWCES